MIDDTKQYISPVWMDEGIDTLLNNFTDKAVYVFSLDEFEQVFGSFFAGEVKEWGCDIVVVRYGDMIRCTPSFIPRLHIRKVEPKTNASRRSFVWDTDTAETHYIAL